MPKKNPGISLKIRIFLFFFGILSVMILLFILSFYRFVSKSTFEKMDKDYTFMVNELSDTSQTLLWKLTLTSQQLLENEEVQDLLIAYRDSTNVYQKQTYYSQLVDLVSLLTMSETDVALFYFYDLIKENLIYSSLAVDRLFSDTDYLYQNSLFQYCGPASSQSNLVGNPVFILDRELVLSDGTPIHFSVESGYYSLDKPFNMIKEKSAYVIFTNENGNILYNSMPEEESGKRDMAQILSGKDNAYHTFSQESSQGWFTYIIVPHSVYTSQYQEGLREFIIFSFILAIIVAIIAFLFWRSIYHPLQVFDQQLNLVLTEEETTDESPSTIPEFDYLFHKIHLLQKQIQEMLEKAILQEKENTKIQVEKLRAQINPHFLLNTLNTVHWMALMNQQKEIDEITQALSHLLSYNLDRDSYNTSLLHELNAVKEYVRLQKVRFQFSYQETIVPVGSLLNYPCPKFILQPFVENSLTHGYKEQMSISVTIHIEENHLEIRITDTGSGMSPANLKKIQEMIHTISRQPNGKQTLPYADKERYGKRIGLSYVFGILHLYYDGQASVTVDSHREVGTQFCMRLPKLKGRGYNVENIDTRR